MYSFCPPPEAMAFERLAVVFCVSPKPSSENPWFSELSGGQRLCFRLTKQGSLTKNTFQDQNPGRCYVVFSYSAAVVVVRPNFLSLARTAPEFRFNVIAISAAGTPFWWRSRRHWSCSDLIPRRRFLINLGNHR